ncbi:MAG: response regulator [Terriglobales bacterium]
MRLPFTRSLAIAPPRTPILRYGVALLSTLLALIPTLYFSNIAESRLVVFAVAVMVSAWYGGWKPGLAATAFALTVSAYYSLAGRLTPREYRNAIVHLTLFFAVALLICGFNAALRGAQNNLRQSERNFRSLFMNAPYGICRCDGLGIVRDANPALVAMLGYVSAAELRGRHLRSLYADAQQWFQTADYFHARKEFNNLATECARRDGTTLVARISGRSIPNGKNGGAFEIFLEDVTETRTLEQQLRQAQKMEAIGRLAGGIAHDFNNVLMVISGYCEFLLDRIGPDPQLRGPALEIANATERASSLTRQLLAFSRKQMLAPKVLDLNLVVTENLKMLTRMIGEDIDLVMLPGLGLGAVRADPGQIDQVIMNLALNGRDAMPEGGKLTIETANITVDENYARTHAPLSAGEYVMLAISDTGVGMDHETQSRIFEPFFSTKGAKGTGLGLSTVYGIVKQSGGFIFVDSQPQHGTAFRAYLPRVDAHKDAEIATAQNSLVLPRANHGQETILLVEDEAHLRHLTRQYLETQGYRVLEAEDGAAALQIVAGHQGPIDLLLTDVVMPGMNGRELAAHVTNLLPTVRVLYMSGYTENAVGQDGTLDTGINLLQKPFNLLALKDRICEVLDSELVSREIARPSSSPGSADLENNGPPFRAPRFNLHIPLLYRPLGEQNWRPGTTENISRSGVLFQAQEILLPSAPLEISLVLPAEIAGLDSTEVVCRGEVVRSVAAQGPSVSSFLAARILQYDFQNSAPAGLA